MAPIPPHIVASTSSFETAPQVSSEAAPEVSRNIIEATNLKLVSALQQLLARSGSKFGSSRLVIAEDPVEEEAPEDETTAIHGGDQESFEEYLTKDSHNESVKVKIEAKESPTPLQHRGSFTKRLSGSGTPSPKPIKSAKVFEDMKKRIKTTSTKAIKKKSSPKAAIKPEQNFLDSFPLQLHETMQYEWQPSKFHDDHEYLLTESEVIAIRPNVDRQALAARFDAPYKLHPFCRPFCLTKQEHILWLKISMKKESPVKKENINTIKAEPMEVWFGCNGMWQLFKRGVQWKAN